MSKDDKTVYEKMSIFAQSLVPIGIEVIRLLPDSLVLGTGLLSMISLCRSYGVLTLTMVELMFIQRIISTIVGSIAPIGAGPASMNEVCQVGLAFPNMMRISIIEKFGVPSFFPSPVIFFLSGILSYMINAIMEFKRELKSLGGDMHVRSTVGIVLSSFLLFLVFSFRYRYGCESFGSLLVSLIFGVLAGVMLVMQNKVIFGREGLNILNLPMIVMAGESGKPMYVCSKTS